MDENMPAHDFSRLSSFDFEELICDLLQAEWRARLEIFTAGRDSGIDPRAFADGANETIIQCKHVPGSTFSQLLSHLRREELPKVKALAPKRYVLVSSIGLTPENKKALVKLFHPYPRTAARSCIENYSIRYWLLSTARQVTSGTRY
jgi:hypothetical protein